MATDNELSGSGYTVDYNQEVGSNVYKATNSAGVTIAAKVLRSNVANSGDDIENAEKSSKLPNEHPNIIDIYDAIEGNGNKYVFMELFAFNLRTYFNKRDLTSRQKVQLMAQIADGLTFLHEHDIVHRKVKPENLLIYVKQNGSPVVKISDFGSSKFFREDESSTMGTNVGFTPYKAPEFWQKGEDGRLHYTRKVDVFAAGLTFLAMLQTTPKGDLSPTVEIPDNVDDDERGQPIGYIMYERMKYGRDVPQIISEEGDPMTKKVKALIRKMIHPVPKERVSAAFAGSSLHGFLL